MTDYGRGPGSQPWHPDDPLYGDGRWYAGHSGDHPGGWQQPDAHGQYAEYPHPAGQPGYAPDPYQQPPAPAYPAYPSYPTYPYDGGYQSPYPQENSGSYQGGYQGSWPTGGQPQYDPAHAPAYDQYGMPQSGDPYGGDGTGEQPRYPSVPSQQGPQTGQLPSIPHQQAAHQPEPGYPQPDPETGWDPGPDQGESAFFGGDDEDETDEAERSRGGGTKRKRRGGCACLVISLVIVGGLGTVGYFGWEFYQSRFAPAPDYEGRGSGEVQVDIPDGAVLADMGRVLTDEGVTKSAGAFIEAAAENEKAQAIQPGTYTLRKRMSGAAAVTMMLDPTSQNGLIVAEGLRATRIYSLIDEKLDVPKGTTKKAAESGDIGLPSWAKGKPEGFLFPSRYSVGKKAEPKDVLRQMVQRAEAEFEKLHLASKAKRVDRTPREVITIASLIQAEAQQDHEFGKVARVIYNRLDEPMALGFDSTINYALGRSTLNTSVQDTRYPSAYNTYLHRGLPPGPIDNPGHQAIEAALEPTKGDWLYFVTVKPGDTRFTDSKSEHDQNVRDFNEEQRKEKENGG